MKLHRALQIIPHDASLYVTHTPRAYSGAWVVWADVDGEACIVTQFKGPHAAACFVHDWYKAVSS